MHKAIFACAGLWFACAPSLSDGEGARCSETLACDEGLSCYRGFCLQDTASTAQPSAPPDASVAAAREDAAAPVPADAPSDAGAADAAAPFARDAGAPPTTPDAATPDAATLAALEAGAAPPVPDLRAALEAGAVSVADAVLLLDALALPGDCKLKDCCKEAQRAAERARGPKDDQDDDDEACGCGDPQLVSALLCDLL